MKQAIVIGGTSSLGLELANQLAGTYEVIVTGSGKHKPEGLDVRTCDLSGGAELGPNIVGLVEGLPEVELVVYAAGYGQMGTITDLTPEDIGHMACVGLVAPVLLVRELLLKQGKILQFVAITSTSAFTPRLKEPVYTAVKAGLSMFAHSLSMDERVGKTLVVAPGGMRTPFWDGMDVDTSGFLEPAQVAKITLENLTGNYRYKLIKIPRDTGIFEVVEAA